ncbi:MAG: serine hydrolase domain-containing protein, partial [Pseudomonadota bacterium]
WGPSPAGEGLSSKDQLMAIEAIQVRVPGTVTSYSNFGFALLGEIVTEVSGESFADYVRNHILLPLGMDSSDVRLRTTAAPSELPWLAALQAREAKAHRWKDGWYEPYDFPPSRSTIHADAAMSTTARDMAAYMQMHLNRGTLNGTQILSDGTWTRMSQPLFANGPETQANAHGFWTNDYAGHRVIQHTGSINAFKSAMMLLPDLGLGVFVSTNSDSGSKLSGPLARRVVEHFFAPGATEALEPPADYAERAELYNGKYIGTRRSNKRFDKVFSAVAGAVTVSSTDEGYLVLSRQGNSRRYVEVAEHTFDSVEDGGRIQFQLGDDGAVRWLFTEGGSQAYEPPTFFEKPISLAPPLALTVIAALAVLLTAAWRIFRPAAVAAAGRQVAMLWLLRGTAATWLIAFTVFGIALGKVADDANSAIFGPYPFSGLIWSGYLLWLSGLLSLACGVLAVLAWREADGWQLRGKLAYGGVAAIFFLSTIAFYQWNVFTLV